MASARCAWRWSGPPTKVTNCSPRSSRLRPAEAAPLSDREQRPLETGANQLQVMRAQAGVHGEREAAQRRVARDRSVVPVHARMVAVGVVVPDERGVVHAGIDAV